MWFSLREDRSRREITCNLEASRLHKFFAVLQTANYDLLITIVNIANLS